MKNTPVIEATNLTKYYGTNIGIKKITFQVQRGEIFGFLGPNGAGKTTTIRLLLDLLKPTSGKIKILGQALNIHSLELRKRIGYLPGDFTAYQNMTVEEFLNFTAAIRESPIRTFPELLERFSLAENRSQKIKHLSHGNRQKLGIIQAFSHHPELVILDEPTTGLDPLIQEEFYIFLEEYQDKGNTIFFSSHNLPEVEKICKRVAIVRQGSLIALEELETLKMKRYRRLKIVLRQPVEKFELEGAEKIKQHGVEYEFLIEGSIQQILQQLVHLPIVDIILPEPDLEEVFLYYYRGKDEV